MALALPKSMRAPLSSSLLDQIGNTPLLRLAKLDAEFPGMEPTQLADLPVVVQFGSWIGGDRDGNPFVDVDTTLKVILVPIQQSHQYQLCPIRKLASPCPIQNTVYVHSAGNITSGMMPKLFCVRPLALVHLLPCRTSA